MKRLTDRIAYEDRDDELHVVNRLPFLPAAAAGYFALAAICLASSVSVLFIPVASLATRVLVLLWVTAGMLPMTLWILFLALWSLRGEEELQVGGGRLTVQRRLGPLKLRRRVFEIRRVSRMRGEPYTLPWQRVPDNILATIEYHGLRRGSIRFDYGGRTKRIGAKLDEHDTQQLLELLRHHIRRSRRRD